MTILDKIKEGSQEVDGVLQKHLSRFPGLCNDMVSTFANPWPPMSDSANIRAPLGWLPATGSQEERTGKVSHQDV